jgi:hypothetical protein
MFLCFVDSAIISQRSPVNYEALPLPVETIPTRRICLLNPLPAPFLCNFNYP